MPPGLVRLPPTRTRRGCRGRGHSDNGALPLDGCGGEALPPACDATQSPGKGRQTLAWGQQVMQQRLDQIENRLLALMNRKEERGEQYTYWIVHRYTMLNPFNMFEKDTRMTCLQLLVWRSNIYGYRAGPFTTYLWKDRH
jgi:hypothetical protein